MVANKKSIRPAGLLVSAMLLTLVVRSQAAGFTAGNLVVDRVGDGTQTLANTGNTQFIDEYTTLGAPTGVSVLVSDSGSNSLIVSGTATSEGNISLSGDRSVLTVAGYNTPRPFASSLTASTSAAVPRAYGTVSASGAYTFGNNFGTAFSANNIRSAVASGANAWAAGATTGTVITGGTVVQGTLANTRVMNIFNNKLFLSTGSGTSRGVYAFADLPAGAETATVLINMGANASPYDYVFNGSMSLAYVADDTTSSAGGIYRFHSSDGGATWVQDYILGTGAANIGAHGLAVDFSGANPIVYATTAEGTANRLISIVDAGAASASNTLATAPSGEIFRGLEFAPSAAAPEPASLAVLGLGGIALLARRRK